MRGDSRRDFYAKSLALMGLGLLAAAGAVVDYWPVGGQPPLVAASALPRPEAPRLVQDFSREIPAPVQAMASAVPASDPIPTLPTPVAELDLVMSELPAVVVVPEPMPAPEPLALHVAFGGPALVTDHADVTLLDPPAMPGPGGPASLLTGALRKTGSSLADAFRGVVGAFRKVSPF